MNIGIILAAGKGERFGGEIEKQFCYLNNKMIIDYSISAFQKAKNIHQIIIVTSEKWIEKLNNLYSDHTIVKGGKPRQESALNALEICPKNTTNVLIHDAARPFIKTSLIEQSIDYLKEYQAVVVSRQATDTIMRVKNKKIIKMEDRKDFFLNQTPQSFNYKLIYNAYKKEQKNVTDDISLINLEKTNYKIIEGSSYNIKITNTEDLKLAESILKLIK